MLNFQVGEKAVFPSHGLAEIQSIESKEIAGSKMEFYIMKIIDTKTTVMVPTNSCEQAGIRSLSDERQVGEVFEVLQTPGEVTHKTWKKRCKDFSERMNSGNIIELAKVARDLSALGETKDLSFDEKKMLEKSLELISTEVSLVQGADQLTVTSKLKDLLGS